MANTDIELGEVDAIGETFRSLLAYEEEKERDRAYHRPSIFRVPSVQRDISPSSYTPKVVAIGPLHREAKNLQEMEARKPVYVDILLAGLKLPPEETLEACVQKVTAKINEIKESYDMEFYYSDEYLARMMVIDGLFILAFFCHLFKKDVFRYQSIIEDLVMLENQIPFFVLQDLFECTISKREVFNVSLIQFIIRNVLNYVPLLALLRQDIDFQGTTPDHILSLLHMCYHPDKSIRPEFYRKKSIEPKFENSHLRSAIELDRAAVKFKPMYDPSCPMEIEVEPSRFGCFSWSWGKPTPRMPTMILDDYKFENSPLRSAIELDRVGVKFKPMYDPSWPMAIEVKPSRFGCFSWSWGKPTLRMPTLILDDYTESVTRNLIVYEQSDEQSDEVAHVPTYFTSYVSALDALVDTTEDIALLIQSGVLINRTGSNEEAASIIHRINKKITCTEFFYGEQWNEIKRYYNGNWNKLRRTYFRSPWNFINLLAGIILFALTIVQTIYTINAA